MSKTDKDKSVERSRLALLGGMTAAAAGGGCQQTKGTRPLDLGLALRKRPKPITHQERRRRAAREAARIKKSNEDWRKAQAEDRARKAKRRGKRYPTPTQPIGGGEGGGDGGGGGGTH